MSKSDRKAIKQLRKNKQKRTVATQWAEYCGRDVKVNRCG